MVSEVMHMDAIVKLRTEIIYEKINKQYGNIEKIKMPILNFLLLREALSLHTDEELHKIATLVSYDEYRESVSWEIISRFMRYTIRKCMKCNCFYDLEVHHTKEAYEVLGCEYKYLDLLMVLCRGCHCKLGGFPDTPGLRAGYYKVSQIIPKTISKIERAYYYAKKIHGYGDLDEALVYGTRSG